MKQTPGGKHKPLKMRMWCHSETLIEEMWSVRGPSREHCPTAPTTNDEKMRKGRRISKETVTLHTQTGRGQEASDGNKSLSRDIATELQNGGGKTFKFQREKAVQK